MATQATYLHSPGAEPINNMLSVGLQSSEVNKSIISGLASYMRQREARGTWDVASGRVQDSLKRVHSAAASGSCEGKWKKAGPPGSASSGFSQAVSPQVPSPLLFPRVPAPLDTLIPAWISKDNCRREAKESGKNGGDVTRDKTNEGKEKKWGAGGAERRDTVPSHHRTLDIRQAAPGVGSHVEGCSEDERESGITIKL